MKAAIVRTVLLGLLYFALLMTVSVSAGALPASYLPSIQKRVETAHVVCSATILRTYATSNRIEVGDELADQWTAQASVDRVFKGAVPSQIIHFDYYRLVPRTPDHSGPPTADFKAGVRYAVFLNGGDSDFHVAIPLYKIEIQLSEQTSSEPEPQPSTLSDLAREQLLAVQSAPATIGRLATHYFDWAGELLGKDAIPLVQPFLKENDALVRYQAAWWLSFRDANAVVLSVLLSTMQDQSVEAWARSGAEQRLRDMGVIDHDNR